MASLSSLNFTDDELFPEEEEGRRKGGGREEEGRRKKGGGRRSITDTQIALLGPFCMLRRKDVTI